MDKISIIIPTYNRENTISECIQSVLRQTYKNIEIIVVDDGSTDNTREYIGNLSDTRIYYIKNEKNIGAAAARNVGVEHATGDIIAFQDSDDVWKVDKLEKQMKYWKMHPEYSMIYCSYCLHGVEKNYIIPGDDIEGELEGDIFPWLLLRNSIGTPTMLMYKECFQELNGFNRNYDSLEDWEFAIRFAEKYLIGFCKEILVDARVSRGGVSSNIVAFYENRCKMIAAYNNQMQKYGIFDMAVMDLFHRAEIHNILDVVKRMLMAYLHFEKD